MYYFDFSSLLISYPFILKGLWVTTQIAVTAIVIGIIWGTILALLRLFAPKPIAFLAALYVNTFRSIPLLMVLLWFYLVIGPGLQRLLGIESNQVRLVWAMIAFTLFEAAYYSEIIRAGIQSVSRGQIHAGLALGMTYPQALRLVVLPQAFRNMIPLLLTQGIILFQDTSLVYVMGLSDFFGSSYKVGERDGAIVEMVLFAGFVYFIICFGASLIVKAYVKRTQI